MKKQLLTMSLVSTIILGNMPLTLAADTLEGTTPADVTFTSKADPSNPQLPGDGSEITPLDPENPEETLPPTGNDGMLRLDFVSNFYFGKQQATMQEDKTYYAAAQPYKQVDEDGNETRDLVNNYVQVTDNRGDSEASWKLYVKQDDEFRTSAGDPLVGAQLSIGALGLRTTADGGGTPPTTADPNGTEEHDGRYVLDPAEAVQLIDGQAGEGAGTWFVELGQTLTPNDGSYGQYAEGISKLSKDVQLLVPGSATKVSQGKYRTTLTWTMQDVPGIPPEETLAFTIKNVKDEIATSAHRTIEPLKLSSNVEGTTYRIEGAPSDKTYVDAETNYFYFGSDLADNTEITITAMTQGGQSETGTVTVLPFVKNEVIAIPDKEGQLIDWKIMKEDERNKVLMVTDEIQKKEVVFNPTQSDGNDYTNSTLESEMKAFYDNSIAGSALGTFVSGVDLPHTETSDTDITDVTTINGNNTPTAFALSTADVLTTWENDVDRIAKYDGSADWWWLRTPGTTSNYARAVSTGGSVISNTVGGTNGLRPALYLNLVSDIEQ
ncbi:WxL domain-containing protein [Vagococcus xieshaowenii]|uniref:WxL domain-containing protein n=1 Tax=Vagococcus xieshaowenii TaxID=2562451 RepID=A0AAJ5EE19_9ENTE|nr:WxL domain-containing protein [Vagococcus xieshaowenii]QCA29456.1 WxL domain-containing protein [Vagococcus xieshaowenii]TFZ39617.1 WxL domain-containing protein [Vagococcus xieshaowenii]